MQNASLAVEITNGWAARFALIFHRKLRDKIYMYLSPFLEIKKPWYRITTRGQAK